MLLVSKSSKWWNWKKGFIFKNKIKSHEFFWIRFLNFEWMNQYQYQYQCALAISYEYYREAASMIILDVHHALIVTFFTSQLCQVVFHIAEWIQSNSAVDLQIFASCLVEGRRHGYYYHLVASSIARPSLAIALGTDCWSWRVRNWHYSNPTKAITPCFMNICLQALFHFPVDSLVDMYCIF